MMKVYRTVTFRQMTRYCWFFDTFKTLFSLIRHTNVLCSSSKKVVACFTIISNLTVTTHVSVNNVGADIFLKGIFIMEHWIQHAWWLKNNFNPIQDGLFRGCSGIRGGGGKRPALPKICNIYPTMMKLGTVIP